MNKCGCVWDCSHAWCGCKATHKCSEYRCENQARKNWHRCEDHIPDDMGGQST